MLKVGLEIHGYLNTNEKLFCRCKVLHGKKHSESNVNICPVCTGQPGSKPLLPNTEAVKKVIEIAIILGCRISPEGLWQRKHYSWPDLPKGFQSTISGPHSVPSGTGGKFMGIRIKECHLEEDPAAWNPITGEVDYNRSGAPLVEIVTEPDFKTSEEVVSWLGNLMSTLSYVSAIDKKSGLKAEVNVSITGGERVEIKNINSFRKIKEAIDLEFTRQEKNPPKIEETRTYDEEKKMTVLMRTKDSAMDYRFISEPDLPVLKISQVLINEIKKSIPKLPFEKMKKLVTKYKIEKRYAEILTKRLSLVELFEELVKKVKPEIAIPWVSVELLGVANYNKMDVDEIDINPEHFTKLLLAVESGKISELKAKDILRGWAKGSSPPEKEIEEGKKIELKEIDKIAKEVIKENEKAVKDYKAGQKNSLNFLIGEIMKKSGKRAGFKETREALLGILG